jgi:hypothetical protein
MGVYVKCGPRLTRPLHCALHDLFNSGIQPGVSLSSRVREDILGSTQKLLKGYVKLKKKILFRDKPYKLLCS